MSAIRKAGLMAALFTTTLLGQGVVLAQTGTDDATNVSAQRDAGDGADAALLLDDATLDAMTSPIALYPDTLLGQVLVATTYPLDVLRADRFLSDNAKMPEDERTAAVNEKDWPDSVKSLAAGFPELIGRMAEHSDWTETMGEALIAQTDDVLLSIQRLRAQAQVNGYLDNNAAMSVQTDPVTENITIAATDPNVVYVPEYTNVVYTQAAPSTPYYVYDNDGNDDDWGDALVTGAIIFGTAVIIDNIFDDDWGNGWDNGYWDGNGGGNGSGNSIDWNGDLNIDNGINIGNGNGNGNGIGNGIGNGNRPNIGNGDMIIGGDKMANIDRSKITDFDRDSLGNGNGGQIGALDRGKLDKARDANFNPTATDRDAARAKIADKAASGKDVSTLPAAKGNGASRDYATGPSTKIATKPANSAAATKAVGAKPKAAAAKPKSPKVSKPSSGAKPATARKPSKNDPAFLPQGGSRSGAASARGHASKKGR